MSRRVLLQLKHLYILSHTPQLTLSFEFSVDAVCPGYSSAFKILALTAKPHDRVRVAQGVITELSSSAPNNPAVRLHPPQPCFHGNMPS